MAHVASHGRGLTYDVIDIAPPWAHPVETIIFHHGIGVNRHLWRGWLPALASRYRVVLFDMFGCGESPAGTRREDWAAERRVDDVLAIADAVGARDFHLVGESFGGTIALMVGLRAPDRTTSLTICNGAHVGSSIQSVGVWDRMLREGGVAAWSDHMMKQRFWPGALAPDQEAWYSRQQASHTAESITEILAALLALDIAEKVSQLAMPVLLMHPDASPFIPVSVMADLHARLPRSEMQVFAHARHGLPFSHSTECAAVLRTFLARQAEASRRT